MARRRDIVLARVEFSEKTGYKIRPSIVLSDERYRRFGFILAAQISTAGDEYCLPITEADANCRFYEGSGARFDGITKLRPEEVGDTIGKASGEYYAKLVEHIMLTIRAKVEAQ